MDKKQVQVGSRFYNYSKDKNNNTILSRKETLYDQEIDVVIKSGDSSSNEEINKYITDVLSELYIERKIKEF